MSPAGRHDARVEDPRILARALAAPRVAEDGAHGAAPLMPVREMESLIALGEAAVADVGEALREALRGAIADPLHAIIVAGQIGSPEFTASLLEFIVDPAVEPACGIAAMEALARIGEAAVPELTQLLASSPPAVVRIRAYGALGLLASPLAAHVLADALTREHEAAGALGTAIAEHAARSSLGALYLKAIYDTYRSAPDHENAVLEEAIRTVAGLNPATPHPSQRNWRTRYRRRPAQNWGIESGWEAQAVLASQVRDVPGAPCLPTPPKRSLEEILASADEDDILPSYVELGRGRAPRGYCRFCGLREQEIGGIRTCPLLARELLRAQRWLLTGWISEGKGDLYARLDEIDLAQAQGLAQLAKLAGDPAADDDLDDAPLTRQLDRLAAERRTLQFLIEEGAVTAPQGLALLAALLRRAPRVSREELERHGIIKPWRA